MVVAVRRCCLVLDGSALGACGGASSEGAAVTGHRSLVDPLMSPFVFAFLFFGFVWVLLPQLLWCCVCIICCMVVVALFIKRGESLFRDNDKM